MREISLNYGYQGHVATAQVDDDLYEVLNSHKWFIAGKGKFLASPRVHISVLNNEGYTVKVPIYLTRFVWLVRIQPEVTKYFLIQSYSEIFRLLKDVPKLTVRDGNYFNCQSSNLTPRKGQTLKDNFLRTPEFGFAPRGSTQIPLKPMTSVSGSGAEVEEPSFRLVENQETDEEIVDETRAEIIMISPNYPEFDPSVLDDIFDEDRKSRIIARAKERRDKMDAKKAQNAIFEKMTGMKVR